MTSDGTNGDSLLEFRTVWLSAIAKAWIEPSFKAELVDSSAAEHVLRKTFDYDWPWEGTLTLKVFDGKGCDWIGDNWVWPRDVAGGDGMTLFVPLDPPTGAHSKPLDPAEHAVALSDYYRMRPSLLTAVGPLQSWSFNVSSALWNHLSQGVSPISKAPNQLTRSAQRYASPAPEGGLVPDESEFASFEVALIYAISKAWENEVFRRYLQENPEFAIATCHGYQPPMALDLKIVNDEGAKWDSGARLPSGKWQNLRPTVLKLGIPQKPQDVRDFSIALASYNATGAQYPFTCCA